jgi:hypothetical protein
MRNYLGISVFLVLYVFTSLNVSAHEAFPRLMGMNIGEKHYHDTAYQRELAKLDIVILGFYRGWGGRPDAMRQVVRELKRQNPAILVGQYSVMNELRDEAKDQALADSRSKVGDAAWWLRNHAGNRVQWTSQFNAWEVNFTHLAKADAQGKRYPQWLAERDYRVYHEPVPEFDFWYTDNVMRRPRVRADWDGDGVDDDPQSPRILKAWREGYVAWWARIRELTPNKLIMGNADSDLAEPEYRSRLEAVFLEAMMGKSWSIEARQGWWAMMMRYRAVKTNLLEPRIVGFNVWGDSKDYRFFRFAFASCLLDDAYFSFTDQARGYSNVPWFDEYDVQLGRAVSGPPSMPWRGTVWRRDFEQGIVLVNPGPGTMKIELEDGLARFAGRQDPTVNNGRGVREVVIPARDGLVLVRRAQ